MSRDTHPRILRLSDGVRDLLGDNVAHALRSGGGVMRLTRESQGRNLYSPGRAQGKARERPGRGQGRGCHTLLSDTTKSMTQCLHTREDTKCTSTSCCKHVTDWMSW